MEEKKKTKKLLEMPIVNPYSAGIDISDKEHVVAVAPGLSNTRVRAFGAMTCDIIELADYLEECEVESVAMESTGVYWKPLFSLLVSRGFEVLLCNAAHVKNVTGRKDDENDAMWIQKLHSCGLLSSSFLPDDEQNALRTIVRFRRTLTNDSSRCINRMQKSLELMNIKFHTIISDITGKSGLAVIEAILNGERNPEKFLPFIDPRVKATPEEIKKSLEGTWREEYLFTLKENFGMYQHYNLRIAACDVEIEKLLQKMEAKMNEGEVITKKKADTKESQPKRRKKKQKNHPKMDMRSYLERIHGVDVLGIDGLSEIGGMEILAETGTDLSKWKNEKHFASWLNLCPNNKISGGKLISSRLLSKKTNAAAMAFRYAANANRSCDNYLGYYFRKMRSKGGHKYAIVATANKIATIYYLMLTRKVEFNPINVKEYRKKHEQCKIEYLESKLAKLKEQIAA